MYRRKNLYALIPVLMSVIAIPQLLFYWLAPETASARTAVYWFGTVLTVVSPVVPFIAHWLYGLRRCIGVGIVSAILEVLTVVVCIALLCLDTTTRTAVFALSITMLAYVICIIPMFISVMHPVGESGMSLVSGNDYWDARHEDHEVSVRNNTSAKNSQKVQEHIQRANMLSRTENRSASSATPLPPRKR